MVQFQIKSDTPTSKQLKSVITSIPINNNKDIKNRQNFTLEVNHMNLNPSSIIQTKSG